MKSPEKCSPSEDQSSCRLTRIGLCQCKIMNEIACSWLSNVRQKYAESLENPCNHAFSLADRWQINEKSLIEIEGGVVNLRSKIVMECLMNH